MTPHGVAYEQFLALHRPQLERSRVPELYWNSLFHKLEHEVFDAGGMFTILQVEHEEEPDEDQVATDEAESEPVCSWTVAVACENGLKTQNHFNIYLIDHAWTYQARHARQQLLSMIPLRERMANLMDIQLEGQEVDDVVDCILTQMWRFNQTYNFANASQEDDSLLEPVWYVMDEFGSRIQHSNSPNVCTAPFYHVTSQTAYTLLWPLKDMEYEEEVTRDYCHGIKDELLRGIKLLPWQEEDFSHLSWEQEPFSSEYYKSYSMTETLPDVSQTPAHSQGQGDSVLHVFSDIEQVKIFLKHPKFAITDDLEKADIWWIKTHFTDYQSFSTNHSSKYINQFPSEMLVTVKDPLAAVSRRAAKSSNPNHETMETEPKWLPTTYNLQTELLKFVSYFQNREKKGLDNHWILKPWNMARGLDMQITNDLDQIIRLQESSPKISAKFKNTRFKTIKDMVACKYIEHPVLFHREEIGDVKFDIRYIVLLAQTRPLKLYAYRVFWLRFANKPYSLDHLDEYEKHFTVMNYQDAANLKQVHYDEFIPMFEKQFPDHPWSEIEESIFSMFSELFRAAASEGPPAGMPSSPQSRAIYAIDLMLNWSTNDKGERCMQPMVCEVNFCPDCERACKYHPNFYDDIFSALFLEEVEGRPVTLIS